jgi:hypothetical protein
LFDGNFDRSLEFDIGPTVGIFPPPLEQQQFSSLPVKLGLTPVLLVCVSDSDGFVYMSRIPEVAFPALRYSAARIPRW